MIWRVLIFWWLGLGLARGDYAPRSIADTFRAGNLLNRTNNALTQAFTVNSLNELSSVARTGTLTVSGALPVPSSGVTVNGAAAQTNGDFTFAATGNALSNGTNTFTIIATNLYGLVITNTLSLNLPATVNYQYDANGNLTNDGTRSFVYDAENRLTNVYVTNVWQVGFAYDGLGRRRIATNSTWQSDAWVVTNITRYIYDGTVVLQERNSNNIPTVTYTRGLDLSTTLGGGGGIGGLLARTDTNGITYYHSDGNGNVTALMNGVQVIVARYEYDPFGRVIGQWGTNAAANVYRFSSKEYDSLTGLYYYGARFYDPTLERFLNRDPLGELGGINLYQAMRNNPLRFVDPHGLDAFGDAMADMDTSDDMAYTQSAAMTQTLVNQAEEGYALGMANIAASEVLGEAAEAVGNAIAEALGSLADGLGFGTPIPDVPIPAEVPPTANPCPSEKPPVVIGRNMDRVVPFAQENGFDYYIPPEYFPTTDENLAYNAAQIQQWQDEGRLFIDLGPDPENPSPSVYYNMESEMVSENSVPVVSFYGFK